MCERFRFSTTYPNSPYLPLRLSLDEVKTRPGEPKERYTSVMLHGVGALCVWPDISSSKPPIEENQGASSIKVPARQRLCRSIIGISLGHSSTSISCSPSTITLEEITRPFKIQRIKTSQRSIMPLLSLGGSVFGLCLQAVRCFNPRAFIFQCRITLPDRAE